MLKQKLIIFIYTFISLCISPSFCFAQTDSDGLGNTIQIYSHLRSYVGKATWLLIIRDVDHGQNIPYFFEFSKGDDSWVVFTYSRDYLILASRLQIESYQGLYNTYKNYRIFNFCGLESRGRIIRGESIYITLNGDLSPNADTYTCHVSKFPENNFTVVKTNSE